MTVFVLQIWYTRSLKPYHWDDWSIEQKWVMILLPLLLLYNSKCVSALLYYFYIHEGKAYFYSYIECVCSIHYRLAASSVSTILF